MSALLEPAAPSTSLTLSLGENPGAVVEAAVWAMAALVSTERQALAEPLADVLACDPQRTAVLESLGLVPRGPDGFVVHSSLDQVDAATARSAVEAKRRGGKPHPRRGHRRRRVGPGAGPGFPQGMGGGHRRTGPGAGSGVELAAADPAVAARVSLRRQDAADVSETDTYRLIWLPAPFLSEEALRAALPRLVEALEQGSWLMVGTDPVADDALRRSVGRWTAVRGGGNSFDAARMSEELEPLGLGEARTFPTLPGGPVLVAARRRVC
jgi:hypothetical protein